MLYPGSPSATLRAPPRFPRCPVIDPGSVMTGVGNLQLAHDCLLPVVIQPVHVIFDRYWKRFLGSELAGIPWGPDASDESQVPRRSAGGRTRRCDRAGGEPAAVRRRLRASPGESGGRAPWGAERPCTMEASQLAGLIVREGVALQPVAWFPATGGALASSHTQDWAFFV